MIQPKESTTAKERTIIEEEESSKRESDNKENELEKPEDQVEESEEEELSFIFNYEVCLVNFWVVMFCLLHHLRHPQWKGQKGI